MAAWRDDRVVVVDDTTIEIQNAASGSPLTKVPLNNEVAGQAAVFGDSLYVTLTSSSFEDGGVWRTTVGEADLVNVIPGTGQAGTDGLPAREGLYLSPSGQTLASSVCTKDGCQTQVADLAKGTIQSIDDASAAWVSDLVVVVYQNYNLRAYDLTSGSKLWELTTEGVFYQGYFLTDERTLLLTSSEAPGDAFRYEIATVEALTGKRTVVTSFDSSPLRDMRVMPELSSDGFAVLLSAYTLDEAITSPDTRMRILDLSTGQLLDVDRAFP